jgi:alpha-tubulin suppressor-like RCC1 family protein
MGDHFSDPASIGFVSVSTTPGVRVQHLAAGSGTTCALLSDGTLKCWGAGRYGQLGYGNTHSIGDDELPSSVGPISVTTTPGVTVQRVAGGLIHTCALLSDGSLKCWGGSCCNGYGAGIGDDELPSAVEPLRISTTSNVAVRELALNGASSCVLLVDGSVKCWGANEFGELGYGNTTRVVTPSSVGTVSVTATSGVRVTQLVAGYQHVCALLSDSSVKCWGYAQYGQLGYGNTRNIGDNELPSSVGSVRITTAPGVRVTRLAAGAHHTCALLSNDTVHCWGLNNFGQLGYGNTRNIGDDELPASAGVVSITTTPGVTVKQLALGDYHTCALLSNSSIQCWGENSLGQLGYRETWRIGDDELPSSVGPVVLFF